VEFTPEGQSRARYEAGDGVAQVDSRTWAFRGRDILEAWFRFARSF
jgi:hypothetical protein